VLPGQHVTDVLVVGVDVVYYGVSVILNRGCKYDYLIFLTHIFDECHQVWTKFYWNL